MAQSPGLKVQGYAGVIVKPENTEIDRNRNWALKTAERLIKDDPKAVGKMITVNKAKDRGVFVNNQPAFLQKQRYAKGGEFVGEFAHLHLP